MCDAYHSPATCPLFHIHLLEQHKIKLNGLCCPSRSHQPLLKLEDEHINGWCCWWAIHSNIILSIFFWNEKEKLFSIKCNRATWKHKYILLSGKHMCESDHMTKIWNWKLRPTHLGILLCLKCWAQQDNFNLN